MQYLCASMLFKLPIVQDCLNPSLEVQSYLHLVENVFEVLNLNLSWMVRSVLFQHLTIIKNVKVSQKKAQTLRSLLPVASSP